MGEYLQKIRFEHTKIKSILTSNFQKVKQYVSANRHNEANSYTSEIHEQTSMESSSAASGPAQDQSIGFDQVLADSEIVYEESKGTKKEANSDSDEEIFYDACDAYIIDEIQKEIKRESEVYDIEQTNKQEYRTTLPAYKSDGKFSLLKVIKDAIGKDITRFCVPVYFNEPIGMLQKVSEFMGNHDLLDKAAQESDSLLRLTHITGFCIGQYGLTTSRTTKPFNPLLGETFEYIGDGWKLFAEQVSHHPPISAVFVESKLWKVQMNTQMKTHFWGKSLEFKPQGKTHIIFKDNGDHFILQRPNSSCRNIIFGSMYIDHHGPMTVLNSRTNEQSKCIFHKISKSMFGSNKKEWNRRRSHF